MGRPDLLRAVSMHARHTTDPLSDLAESPLYLLAVLCSARRSKDRALERLTRRQLDKLGVRVAFGDELPPPTLDSEGEGGPAMNDLLPLRTPKPDSPARKHRRLSPLVVAARRLAKLLCVGVRTVRTWNEHGTGGGRKRLGVQTEQNASKVNMAGFSWRAFRPGNPAILARSRLMFTPEK